MLPLRPYRSSGLQHVVRRNPNWPHNLLIPRSEALRIVGLPGKRTPSTATEFSAPAPPTRDAKKTIGKGRQTRLPSYGDGIVAWAGGDESAL